LTISRGQRIGPGVGIKIQVSRIVPRFGLTIS
jgi:hypothetical protein